MESTWMPSGKHDRDIRRAHERGELVRLYRGVYLGREEWEALSLDARYAARVRAYASVHPGAVFSHQSAAVLQGLPLIGAMPERLHRLVDRRAIGASGRSTRYVAAHPADLADVRVASFGAVQATDLVRTAVDLAAAEPFLSAIAAADVALARMRGDRDAFRQELVSVSPRFGASRASEAVELATVLSESAGESVSRGIMHLAGFPPPVLQHVFRDAFGFVARVDFWWPEYGLVGEFDGRGKYLEAGYIRGRDSADIVLTEKRREDRVRALGPRVVRWDWTDVRDPRRLRTILRSAGLPQPGRDRLDAYCAARTGVRRGSAEPQGARGAAFWLG